MSGLLCDEGSSACWAQAGFCWLSKAQGPALPPLSTRPEPEQALLADERRTGRAREARHKLTVERLRQQVLELQERNTELRGQVQALDSQRLAQAWGEPAAGGTAGAAAPGAAAVSPGAGVSAAAVHRHIAAPPARKGAVAAAAAQAGRQRRPGSLPVVRVERGGGGACAGQPAVFQPLLPSSWEEMEEAEEHGGEELIADVHLSDEEVVLWEAEDAGEEQQEELGWQQETGGQQEMQGALCGDVLDAGGSSSTRVPSSSGGAWTAGAPPAAAAVAPLPVVGDAASKATSALARFNQLRDSLAHQRGLASEPSSLQQSPAMPLGAAVQAGMAPSAAAPPAGSLCGTASQDDLRRLGRSLLAGGGSGDLLPAAPSAAAPVPVAGAPSAAAPAAACGSSGDGVVSEVQHPDGRWELLYTSGLREQRFANGSVKQQAPGGATLTRFANGDVKKTLPGGVVEYWYAEVASWQVTYPSGIDVFFFSSGQVWAAWWAVGSCLCRSGGCNLTDLPCGMLYCAASWPRAAGRRPAATVSSPPQHTAQTPSPPHPHRWKPTTPGM